MWYRQARHLRKCEGLNSESSFATLHGDANFQICTRGVLEAGVHLIYRFILFQQPLAAPRPIISLEESLLGVSESDLFRALPRGSAAWDS